MFQGGVRSRPKCCGKLARVCRSDERVEASLASAITVTAGFDDPASNSSPGLQTFFYQGDLFCTGRSSGEGACFDSLFLSLSRGRVDWGIRTQWVRLLLGLIRSPPYFSDTTCLNAGNCQRLSQARRVSRDDGNTGVRVMTRRLKM